MIGTISYAQMQENIDNLISYANNMDGYFDEIKQYVNSIGTVYVGQGADTAYTEFKTLEPKLDNFSNEIRLYAKFLQEVVDQYVAADNVTAA